jgi:hypothetical protein
MGGPGSGRRWRFDAAACTDAYHRIDVRRWQRDGFLTPGRAFNWQWTRNGGTAAWISVRTEADRVVMSYRHRRDGGEWKGEEHPVRLDWTPCTYGGQRVWFLCPVAGCGRRVALLYGGPVFACRHCHRLAYRCQREAFHERAARRADKIRARLGWAPGILNDAGDKPKGMRWRTFGRLVGEHEDLAGASLAAMAGRLGLSREWVG